MGHDNTRDSQQHLSVHNTLDTVVHGSAYQIGQVHGGVTISVQAAAPGPAPGSPTRPDDVPPARSGFVNRIGEQDRVCSWLAQDQAGAVSAALVSGLAGVGKRAMVRRLAHHGLKDRFPDGQLYVDFAACAGGGDVSEALAVCLKALGQGDDFRPGSVEDRLREYRRLSGGRRLLVVLENVTQPAQIRLLTPKGAGSAVLATSDLALGEVALDQVRLMKLKPLDHEASLQLLTALCEPEQIGADPGAARRVVAQCAGLPVALHIVAARLAMHPGLTLGAVADELHDESARLPGMTVQTSEGERSVSGPFDVAYHALDPEQARVYRLLGTLPVTGFDTGTAAATAQTPDIRPVLAHLVRCSLLEATPDGRYHLHDLVRLHARSRAEQHTPPPEREEALRRFVTHFLALTAMADRAIQADRLRIADLSALLDGAPDPFGEAGPQAADLALGWLEAERASILAALRTAVRHGWSALAWPLAEAFTVLFHRHRHLADWRESLLLGVDAAVEADNGAAEARLRSMLSRPLLDLGQDDLASEHLETAVLRAEESGNLLLRASVQEFLGRYWERHDLARAVAVFERSLRLNREARDRRGTALAGLFLGRVQGLAGHPEQAVGTLEWAVGEFEELKDVRMAARARGALGEVRARLGDSAGARRDLESAVAGLRSSEAFHYEAQTRIALARVIERSGGDPAAVRAHLDRALEIYEQGGSPDADTVRRRLEDLSGS